MNISDTNKIFRKSILKGFFEPQLLNLDFKKSSVKHPSINDDGLMQSDLLHVFFDMDTGSDYPDGDEWFMVDMIFPYDVKLSDELIGPDFFTTLSVDSGKIFWHHRELVRFKYGKSKKLLDALNFIELKYQQLYDLLKPLQKDLN
ncbi:MAG: hypothetical protein MAG458_00530 [Nitrosopumilus sp.]|nr:hypothetical protein [Nitrosopumilus sp.]